MLLLARTGSKRLPNKPLRRIAGRPIIEHQIARLRLAKRAEAIILCTTRLPEDTSLTDLARRVGVEVYRGATHDVIRRMLGAAKTFGVRFMVVVGADDVFCDPMCIDRTIECFHHTGADYITCQGIPFGVSPFGVRTAALLRVDRLRTTRSTDGWERYFEDFGLFRIARVQIRDAGLDRPDLRLDLDYPEDLALVRAVYRRLFVPGKVFSLRDIVRFLERHPRIASINQGRHRDWLANRAASRIGMRITSGGGAGQAAEHTTRTEQRPMRLSDRKGA